MEKFTRQKIYTNDPETLSRDAKKFREELKQEAVTKGAVENTIKITKKLIKNIQNPGGTITINNPLTNFSEKDAFKLNDKDKNHYLRFGALLEFLVYNVIPTTTDSNLTPMFNIDTEPWYNYMYSLPNQISLDPRVCLVRNSKFDTYESGYTKVLNEIPYFFKEIDNGVSQNENSAYPLNIYLNFNFILECLSADEKGNVSVYELVSRICTGLNKALGGINNLEPIIDEETNTLQIIDTTPIPGHSAENTGKYKLQIYGYDKISNDYISNFVRKVDLKTVIDPSYATMITVGATAGGYVKGTEATAFSKWNTGLIDRFKEKFIPPTKNLSSSKTDEDDPATMYKEEFATSKGFSSRYGWTSFNSNFKFSDNFIEKNISTVTEYYKWLIAKNAEGKDVSGGTVGFIPFKLGLTLDGISGIKIYNVLHVNTEFLPKAYGKSVDLIVTGVSHTLSNSDWETQIEATVMPKTGEMALVAISAATVVNAIKTATGTPPDPNWPILKNVMGGDGKNSSTATYKYISYKDKAVKKCTPSIDKVNPNLLKDLNTAAKASGAKPIITTAITGHGAGSRHNPSGHAVDIAMFEGKGYKSKQDAKDKKIYDQIIKFVDELIKLGYAKQIEYGKDKGVLFFGYKDNNHENHVHISNKIRS